MRERAISSDDNNSTGGGIVLYVCFGKCRIIIYALHPSVTSLPPTDARHVQLSACYALHLEQDPSTSPTGERAVSNTLPWTRRRVQQEGGDGDATAGGGSACAKVADLAGDIAPLLDRLGRMLTDVAPHLARLSVGTDGQAAPADTVDEAAAEREEDAGAEPGEVPWDLLGSQGGPQGASQGGGQGVSQGGSQGGGARRSLRRGSGGAGGQRGRGRARSVSPEDTSTAFRQLVSTSSPAPTSSNINIHIHAIVPLRAPPSPPPPPPPPPTASASAVATPTRGDRPPLAVAGSRNPPWGGSMDTVGGAASMLAAARAAAASRAATSGRDSETGDSATTPRRLGRGILAEPARSGDHRDVVGAGGGGAGSIVDRNGSVISSASFDVTGIAASPLTVSLPGSLAAVHHSEAPPPAASSSGDSSVVLSESDSGADAGTGDDHTDSSSLGSGSGSSGGQSGGGGGGGQRRNGGWRGLLRALGMGGNGNSRVGGRRDGAEGDHSA